jgi:hypothetical protein
MQGRVPAKMCGCLPEHEDSRTAASLSVVSVGKLAFAIAPAALRHYWSHSE